MSFPFQIAIHGARVRATAEAVCRRLGGGPRGVAWSLVWDDQPDPGARLDAAARRMAEVWGGRGEGGHGQLVIADSAAALAEVAAVLGARPRSPHLWCRVAVVLDDAVPASVSAPFDAVHLVPSAPGARRLAERDRVQVAGNLLGFVLELARLDDARSVVARFLDAYPGVWSSLAAVARFNAPAIRSVLAARLAATVAGRMRAAVRRGDAQPSRALEAPELPEALFVAAGLGRVARTMGRRVAAGVEAGAVAGLGDGAGVAERVAADAREDIVRAGHGAMEAADATARELRRAVDQALASASFAAIGPVRRDLAALGREVDAALARCGGVPGGLAPLVAPSDAALTEARAALAAAWADDAPTGSLFAAWALVAAVVTGVTVGPFLAGADAPSLLAALPGGAFAAAGLASVAVSGLVAGVSRAGRRRRLAALERAADEAAEVLGDAWADAVAAHLGDVGRLLERRALRHVAAAVAREEALLAAVAGQIEALEERFRRDGAAPQPVGQPFDVYVPVGAALYDAAALSAPPEERFRRAEAALTEPSWRDALAFMDGEAFLASCRAAFDAFADGLPLASRQDLRAAVAGPTRDALAGLAHHLDRFVPPGAPAARLVVVPAALADAVPDELDREATRWPGSSDLFCAVFARVEATGFGAGEGDGDGDGDGPGPGAGHWSGGFQPPHVSEGVGAHHIVREARRWSGGFQPPHVSEGVDSHAPGLGVPPHEGPAGSRRSKAHAHDIVREARRWSGGFQPPHVSEGGDSRHSKAHAHAPGLGAPPHEGPAGSRHSKAHGHAPGSCAPPHEGPAGSRHSKAHAHDIVREARRWSGGFQPPHVSEGLAASRRSQATHPQAPGRPA